MIEIALGSETDEKLVEELKRVVRDLGGKIRKKDWGVGGSQEVITYTITLPQGDLELISETYIGLSLRGDENIVGILAQRLLPNHAINPDALKRAGYL